MVVSRVLGHIARELSDLDLIFKFTLKAGKENFSLAWLKTIA